MKLPLILFTMFLGIILAVHLAMNGKVGSVLNALAPLRDVHPLLLTAGAMGASLVFAIAWLIPQAGAGPVMITLLAGQILGGLLMSHLGWLGSPVDRITGTKLIGVALMIAGVVIATFRK
jgi:bacterial/archaeal transporter family-2 protein